MEKEQIINLKRFVITAICGFIACLILGLLFFHTFLSFWSPMKYIFIILGLAGALVFASLLLWGIKESLLFLIAVFLLNIVVLKTHLISFIIRDIVLLSSFWLSIYIYKTWFYNSTVKYKFFRAFILGIISAILLFTAGIFLLFINVPLERISIDLIIRISLYYLEIGVLLGLGLGLGFDIADLFVNKNKPEESVQ